MQWAKRNKDRLLREAEKPLLLREFCRDFFADNGSWAARMREKGHSLSPKYLAVRQGHLGNYIMPLLGNLDPRELSGRFIDDTILGIRRKGGKPLAPATKYKIVDSFKIVLEELVERKIIAANPLAGIRTYSKAPVSPRGTLSREAIPKLFPPTHGELIRVWGSPMWASMMLAFLDTGMRPIELSNRKWGDLYMEQFADGTGTHELWSFVFRGAKTGNFRAVGISTRTAQELAIWRPQSKRRKDYDYIFTMDGEKPITDAGILKAFRRSVSEVVGEEGKRWTTYYLRHTFVTHSIATLTEIEVAMLAGHSVQVDRLYQHKDVQIALDQSREARIKLHKMRLLNAPMSNGFTLGYQDDDGSRN
jgi:integrase